MSVAPVACRSCGTSLGTLTHHRPRWVIRAVNVVMHIDLARQQAALLCPSCGERRIISARTIRGIVLPGIDDTLDYGKLVGGERTAG